MNNEENVFLPLTRMLERTKRAREESDAIYFFDLLYLGEMIIKMLVVESLAALQDDREKHRYALEYKAVRANGVGDWVAVLDEALTGPASQHLAPQGHDSQRAITATFGPTEDSWQRRSVDRITEVCAYIDSQYEISRTARSSLRNWTQHFAWLRNRTRGHGAPKSSTLSIACLAMQQSLIEIIDNAPTFKRPWAHLRRSLSGKYRVSSFSGDRTPFEYLTKEAEHSLSDGVYIYFDRPRNAQLLLTDPELTDFFLPNGNFRNSAFELLSYITDESKGNSGDQYILPVEAQPSSETTSSPDIDLIGNVFSNMPPRRDAYVKRPELELELGRLLRDERHPVVTLQGRGGVGKTSLAVEVLHELASLDEFFAIIWFSARDIDLLPEGPRLVKADVLSIDDIAKDFYQLLNTNYSTKVAEIRRFLASSLSGDSPDGPFLFVLDNFETIREQAELYQFLSNAVRLPNKILITTRKREFKADYPIDVTGMTQEEFAELVRETSARLGITSLIDVEYEHRLFEESDGHPYIAKVLLGEVANAGQQVSVKRVVAARDSMLDALFDRSFSSLTSVAQRVFLTLCSWRSLVPQVGLEAVIQRPGNDRLDVERAVAELEQSSLVDTVTDPSSDEAFLSVPLAASLFGKKRLVTSPLKTAIDADLELIRGFGVTTTTDLAKGLGPRVARLTSEAARRAEQGIDIAQDLAVVEYIAGGYAPAWLALAELQGEQEGGIKLAIRSINRYVESYPKDLSAWDKLVHLYRSDGDQLAEMHARLQRAEMANSGLKDISSSASRLNGLLARKEIELDADERKLMVQKFRIRFESFVDEASATDLSRLAWLCLHEKNISAGLKWVREGLALEPDNEHCLRLEKRLRLSDEAG